VFKRVRANWKPPYWEISYCGSPCMHGNILFGLKFVYLHAWIYFGNYSVELHDVCVEYCDHLPACSMQCSNAVGEIFKFENIC
jgi:hypothetical protein